MPRTVILGAARTPFGRLGGGLASLSAPQLGIHAGSAALERAGVSPDRVGYVVMGEVLQAGVGMIPSRQVSAGVGCPVGVGSDTINKVCASGMRATAYGDLLIRSGDHDVVLTGGMESMSNAPYLVPKARFGYTMGDGVLVDHMTSDGLTSTFTHRIMAEENSVVSVEIGSTRGGGRLTIDQHAESHRRSASRGSHHQMQVAGVETIRDPSVRSVQPDRAFVHRPVARKRPVIQPKLRRHGVGARLGHRHATRRRKALGAIVTDVVFRRHQILPVGRRFDPARVHRHQVAADSARAGIHQQLLDHLFRFVVIAFAEVVIAYPSLRIG